MSFPTVSKLECLVLDNYTLLCGFVCFPFSFDSFPLCTSILVRLVMNRSSFPSLFVIAARFDFSWGDPEFHQETLENLKMAVKKTKKLCAVSDLSDSLV